MDVAPARLVIRERVIFMREIAGRLALVAADEIRQVDGIAQMLNSAPHHVQRLFGIVPEGKPKGCLTRVGSGPLQASDALSRGRWLRRASRP